MKIAVVTASVGANFTVEVENPFPHVDYHAFIDFQSEHELPAETMWSLHTIQEWTIDQFYRDRRHAKVYKILPQFFLPGYDYYVWIDSTHAVMKDPVEIVNEYLQDSDIAVFRHPERDCVYDEAHLIQAVKFDNLSFVNQQMVFYESRGYPRNNGLYELPCRIQRNSGLMTATMLTWWELICKYSSRDQLSFPYALREHGVTPTIMPGKANSLWGNEIMPQVLNSDHVRMKAAVEFPRF